MTHFMIHYDTLVTYMRLVIVLQGHRLSTVQYLQDNAIIQKSRIYKLSTSLKVSTVVSFARHSLLKREILHINQLYRDKLKVLDCITDIESYSNVL